MDNCSSSACIKPLYFFSTRGRFGKNSETKIVILIVPKEGSPHEHCLWIKVHTAIVDNHMILRKEEIMDKRRVLFRRGYKVALHLTRAGGETTKLHIPLLLHEVGIGRIGMK